MAVLANWWNRTLEWFHDRKDRASLIRGFNQSARNSFIMGDSPVLMEAYISRGDSSYRHSYSKWMASGFSIKVLSGRQLSKAEMIAIGSTVLSNETLMRRMVVLGWDTLEVHCDIGGIGCKWQIKEFLQLGC